MSSSNPAASSASSNPAAAASRLPPLIAALCEPGRYPDPAAVVDLVETHASWLLLAGDFAYKIKKPITLPFLDYGTLEQRRLCCEAELRLNRRLAPALYLAVVPIAGSPGAPQIGGAGTPIEYAVKMRRFAEEGRLDRVCARGELGYVQVSAMAEAITAFHAGAGVAPAGSRFGSPAQVRAQALANFDELGALLADPIPHADFATRLASLSAWTHAEADRLAPVFAARQAAGCVRECHGDLHLGNLVLIGGRVTPFDCIEFNEEFRWIDVASEIAFTFVDLLDHHQPGLALWWLNETLSCSGDYGAATVLRFYAVYRALVRAKVAAIRATQGASTGLQELSDYLGLAEFLIAPRDRRLVITHGLSGSGKSRAARNLILADASAATLRLRSDVERKRLFGLAAAASSRSVGGGIYGADTNTRTYARLADLAAQILGDGWSVVVDAAFLKRSERMDFRRLADERGVPFAILAPVATVEQMRQRIEARRLKNHDASEATLAVLEQQLQWVEPLDDTEAALRL